MSRGLSPSPGLSTELLECPHSILWGEHPKRAKQQLHCLLGPTLRSYTWSCPPYSTGHTVEMTQRGRCLHMAQIPGPGGITGVSLETSWRFGGRCLRGPVVRFLMCAGGKGWIPFGAETPKKIDAKIAGARAKSLLPLDLRAEESPFSSFTFQSPSAGPC